LSRNFQGSTISVDLIMLPPMNAYDIDQVDQILEARREEITADTVRGLPGFIRDHKPHVLLTTNGDGIDRWLAFGRPPAVEWVQLAPLSAIAVIDQYGDREIA
jgi:hypothetical protein